MRYIPNIFKITFYIVIITLIFNLTAFTQTNSENISTKPFSKERQLLSVNLIPSYSAIFPSFVNSLMNNIKTFTGLAQIDIGEASKYLDYINVKGSFWYIPNISYTFLFNRFIGIELGIGAQSVTYSLNISKNDIPTILGSNEIEIGGQKFNILNVLKGENQNLKASFVYIPIHFGLKIMSGKTHKTVNTFKLGLEALVYDIETENILTGLKTKRHTTDMQIYISYELGWQINLFPNKDWRVKPYIDFSLFEIGYYIKSATGGIYEDVIEGIGFFSGGLFSVNAFPSWNNIGNTFEYGKYVKYVTSLKIAIFPRFGFTIRF